MRRWLVLLIAAAVLLAAWLLRSAGPAGGGGAAPELRIDIREDAATAQASLEAILARYGEEPAARDWVADCLAQLATPNAGAVSPQLAADREAGCWRAYARQAGGEGAP